MNEDELIKGDVIRHRLLYFKDAVRVIVELYKFIDRSFKECFKIKLYDQQL